MRRLFIALDERDLPEDGTVPEGYEPSSSSASIPRSWSAWRTR